MGTAPSGVRSDRADTVRCIAGRAWRGDDDGRMPVDEVGTEGTGVGKYFSTCLGNVGELSSNLRFEDGRGKGEELNVVSSPKAGRRHGFEVGSAGASVDSTSDWCVAGLRDLSMVSCEVVRREAGRVVADRERSAGVSFGLPAADTDAVEVCIGDEKLDKSTAGGQEEEAMRFIETEEVLNTVTKVEMSRRSNASTDT